jgi:xanthine dehydrogenase accessory factor
MHNMLVRAAQLLEEGRPYVLATVTWRRGPSSGKGGSKAIIHPDGSVEGWLGGACAKPTVVRQALDALADGQSRLLLIGDDDHRHGVTTVAMACASEGAMEVYVEPILTAPEIVIVGNSPMCSHLAGLADVMGWRTKLVESLAGVSVGDRSFVVIATQGHADEPELEKALATTAGYVGLVASEKRSSSIREWLRDRGVTDEQLTRLKAPAGLDLGSIEHEEIAVAILAELVALKASGAGAQVVETRAPETAIDPICDMTVDVATAAFMTEWNGTTYYFCAAGCQKAFERDPAAALS